MSSTMSVRAKSPRRRMLLVAGAASLALVAAAASVLTFSPLPAAAASSVPKTTGLSYVALGDSYAAGYGLTPMTGTPVAGCAQSSSNYPHQVAAALGMKLTDVTCTSATTANITTTAQDTGAGVAPIQISALNKKTDVVSLTIGGNDVGFFDIASSCVSLSAAGPLLYDQTIPNCTAMYNAPGYDTLAAKVTSVVQPSIAATLAAIKKAAPNAEIFVVGYPSITPDAANTPATDTACFTPALTAAPPYPVNSFPFSTVDVPYIHSIEVALDTAVQTETKKAGATYIAALSGSVANSACSTTAAFINGITVTQVSPSFDLAFGALHPNTAGTAYVTKLVSSSIAKAFDCNGNGKGNNGNHNGNGNGNGKGHNNNGH